MPVLLRYKGNVFFFFSNEGLPREPPHVHVRHGSAVAKLWLYPSVSVAAARGFNATELRELVRIARANRQLFIKAWEDFFDE
ncbi:DUF4160 domain-containing protein [Massilia endophytica]|uniref:DUF4160 domain-containing protein n=1 Tax=Massilia endophytica TaxID=2899220 RepID=UPI001E31D297|nr:DUF4160 domain-containing protein [Massilia endophytica]UGQ46831.1 DUF4160 domain-containing protein [Massilia endophytica]